MVEEIQTGRLLMRRCRAEDSAALHPIFSNPEAMRYWSTLPHETMAQTEEWVASMMAPADVRDDFILEHEGRVIGKLGCFCLPEVGFILSPEMCGKGLASEALRAFVAHRRRCGSRELTADTDPRNEASIRLLRRHGFVETGRARGTWLIGDQWCDSVYWRLEM